MKYGDVLPFPRGQTWYNGGTIDANNLGGEHLVGTLWTIDDKDDSQGELATPRTGRPVTLMVVRNANATAILAKQVIVLDDTQTTPAKRAGYAKGLCGANGKGFPVDEYLPSTGCVQNDLCYVVVKGPATVTTAGSGTTTIAFNGIVVCAANGVVVAQDTSVATDANTLIQVNAALGRCLTAVAANTTDFLMDVGPGI